MALTDCPSCHKAYNASIYRCPYCGASKDGAPAAVAPLEPEKAPESSRPVIPPGTFDPRPGDQAPRPVLSPEVFAGLNAEQLPQPDVCAVCKGPDPVKKVRA